MHRRFGGVWALLVLATAAPAAAQAPNLELEAVPSLGPSTPVVDGWFSCMVHVTNNGDSALRGSVELINERSWSRDTRRNVTQAPFAVPPQGRVTIELPTRGFQGVPPSLVVRALDDEGRVLKQQDLPDLHPHEPLLFDLDVPSRVAPALRGTGVPAAHTRPYMRYGAPLLAVSTPQINPKTGDPVLPGRAMGYASVTLLLAKSEVLAKISGAEREALASWLLAGGALAVVVTRPEDLRGPTLKALAGGVVNAAAPPATLSAPARFLIAGQAPVPGSTPAPRSQGSLTSKVLAPSAALKSELAGYAGGNLRETRWGAAASYGLGELHLLAFDATREPFASDEWVKHKLVDLMAHAWQRRIAIALPHAQTALDAPQVDQIRRQLDPNEGTRWTIAVSALLLLLYAIVAGPLNFYLASKKGRPLRALWILPLWSMVAFGSIVMLGIAGKGVFGRVRRLTLVESGAGMPRAAATRFRGFFVGSADALTVRGADRSSVLDMAGDDESTDRRLVIDRDGPRLEHFRAKPWQAVIVREDGFIGLGAGVSLVRSGSGDVAITNRLARDLVGVVLKAPGKDAVLFRRLRDGQTALASAGEKLPTSVGSAWSAGTSSLHKLGADGFAKEVDGAAHGLGDAWRAMEALSSEVDWWPDDVPVLIGQVDGGEGRTADSGLRVEIDRVLLRVVGWGGVGG
jgi:hypothetical protein